MTDKKTDSNQLIPRRSYQRWIHAVEVSRREALYATYREINKSADWPLISIVMATYNTPAQYLHAAIESVRSQLYPHWQLCIADDASTASHVRKTIEFHATKDSRIINIWRADNGGIASATNDALAIVSGQYVAFMDHDDTLAEHALLTVAIELKTHTGLQVIYSDSDRLDANGNRCQPFFKPDWNYELLLAQNYLNHLSVYRKGLLEKVGGLNSEFDGAQDYELALRAVEHLQAEEIGHISHILYHWRVVESSVSHSNLGRAAAAGREAVQAHLLRSSLPATVEPVKGAIIYNRVVWNLPEPPPAVTILVYGENLELLAASAQELQKRTKYHQLKLETVCCEAAMGNISHALNAAARQQDADILCFIAAGLAPVADNWLDTIAAHAARSSVGAVGAKFILNDSTVACGPLVLGVADPCGGGLFGPAFAGESKDRKGEFARALLEQQVSAVHGACFACRRDIFLHAGGFNTGLATHTTLGIDYSLKVARLGHQVVWAASVLFNCANTLAAHIFATAPSANELDVLRKDWSQRLSHDPFYNPNFTSNKASFALPSEPECGA